ncbi:MAG: substrate-binding domain-containing protein [Eubacteriales bacterium]|nr:substrate-binding domain-containing protein [Eubacteriales bacterium]
MTKKVLSVALVAAMVGSMTCAVSAADYAGMKIEIVSKGFQHQYWQAVKKGAEEKAEELGCTINFVGPNSESDYADQVQMLNAAINSEPSAIGLAALSTETCLDSIKDAQSKNIPIIGFDSGVPGAPEGAIVANAATDNYAAGELAAEKGYEAIKDKIDAAEAPVRIGVLAQDAVSESVMNRGLGFIDKMAELTGGVKLEGNDAYVNGATCENKDDAKVIIETLVPSQVTSELSAIDCQTLLNKDDIICIYGSNQHSAEAMVTGDENYGRLGNDVVGIGFDSGAVTKAAVASGQFLGAITQAPVAMGAKVVELACAAAAGETVEDVDTGCQWYTAENMEDPEIAQNLYD